MKIERLEIDRIRCLRQVALEPAGGVNVLVGANGQGKTSVLEAVAVLADGRSFRNSRRSFVAWGEDGARVAGTVRQGGRTRALEAIFQGRERRFLVDRTPAAGMAEYVELLGYVAFTSGSVELVSGGPRERRSFLDRGIMGLTPGYIEIYRQYARTARQRAAALAARAAGLDLWDERLAAAALPVMKRRRRYTELVAARAVELYREIAGGLEPLAVRYRPSVPEEDDWKAAVLRQLRLQRRSELERGACLAGPHRDELEITLSGHSAREYASRGQQRGVALALKLAELEVFSAERGEAPVLLLDDIASELDRDRTGLLFSYLAGKPQTLVTATDRDRLADLPGVTRHFRVAAGSVCSEE